jgi:hypothetical protein
MRQAHGALSLLLRTQRARQKREADPETRERAAWTEHCALNMMQQALASLPATPKPTTEPSPTIDLPSHTENADSLNELHHGPTTPAAEPQEEPQLAPLATPEPDERALMQALDDWQGYGITTTPLKARGRFGNPLDGPPGCDLAEPLTDAALQPPTATPALKPAEPAPS